MNDFQNQNKRWFPKIFWTLVIIFLAFFSVLFAKAYNFSSKVFVNDTSFFRKLATVIFNGAGTRLKGESQGKINILLLGYGGEGHDGPYLTDSMVLASIDPNNNLVTLTSIPRDYFWPPLGQKINYAFYAGLSKNNSFSSAGKSADQVVSQLTGTDVPYFAAADFAGFEKAVDRVGGIDVQVDNTFTDAQYPNDANSGYLPPITFTKGLEHMNGARALEFARSRHGNNGENSDFARSKRQEKILSAFKQKVEQSGILSDPSAISGLLNIVANHAHTNLDPGEILHLAKILRAPNLKVVSRSLNIDTGLICQTIDPVNGYILEPCGGVTPGDIRNFFQSGALGNAGVQTESASLILENAGNDPAYYEKIKAKILGAGIQVYEVPYKGLPLQVSVLYEVRNKPATIQYLEQLLNIKAQAKPARMIAKTDLVLFLVNPQ